MPFRSSYGRRYSRRTYMGAKALMGLRARGARGGGGYRRSTFKGRVYAIAKTAVKAGRERKVSDFGTNLAGGVTLDATVGTGIFAVGTTRWSHDGTGVPQLELGRNDSTLGANGAMVSPLVRIAQGIDQYERIGNVVSLSSVQVNGNARLAGAADQIMLRFSIFHDTEPIGGNAPDVSAFYQEDETGEFTNASIRRMANRMRFVNLGETTLKLSATGVFSDTFSLYVPFKRELPAIWNGNTLSVPSDGSSLWFVVTSNRAGDTVQLDVTGRLRFTDA